MPIKVTIQQFIRFGAVGVINTAVDLLVLNSLILLVGLKHGDPKFIYLKAFSFIVAVANSFVWNKVFVFRESDSDKKEKITISHNEVRKFLVISIAGLFINTTIASLVFTIGGKSSLPITTSTLANVSAIAGTIFVLFSNFFGYKFFVFKK